MPVGRTRRDGETESDLETGGAASARSGVRVVVAELSRALAPNKGNRGSSRECTPHMQKSIERAQKESEEIEVCVCAVVGLSVERDSLSRCAMYECIGGAAHGAYMMWLALSLPSLHTECECTAP